VTVEAMQVRSLTPREITHARPAAELLENVVVNIDRDASLAPWRHGRTALPFMKSYWRFILVSLLAGRAAGHPRAGFAHRQAAPKEVGE
jgi:hypothetical protein